MVKKTIFILLFSWAFIQASAQLKVTAALDSTEIIIGDQLFLNFNITQPSGSEFQSADFLKTLDTLEQIELLEIKEARKLNSGNPETIKQSILITSFEDGTHKIPSIRFTSKNGGRLYTAMSNPVYIKVNPVLMDSTQQLMPIKDIIEEPTLWTDWLPYILIPLGIILGLILLVYLVRRLTKKPVEAVVVKKEIIPAHIIALDKLGKLKENELWQKGEIKEYYSEISYISREYLENRYKINALESVTHEIAPDLKDTDISQEMQEKLVQMLRTADMVKFAKVEPDETSHYNVFKVAEDFINETKQLAPPIIIEEEQTEEGE